MANDTLKEKTARGLFWGGLNSLTQQVIGIIFAIILGRLLDNADFGMMAMIGVFSLIATTLQNSGFPTALANMKEPRDEDYNSVFWFNIIVGFSAYIVLFFCAPFIASYYNEPRLVPLCRYAFLSILIASFGTAQNAYLFKNLKARQQAKASMTAVIIASVTGAACAFAGLAYWSLATQGLVYVSINTLLAWHYSPWRPSLHGITFEPVKRMLRFSFKILLSNIATIINNNILNFLLGHYYTAHATGNFNQAYQWDSKCFGLVQSMVNQVAQPVLVDLQSDSNRQLNAFRKLMRFTAFLSFPLLLGFGLVAKEFGLGFAQIVSMLVLWPHGIMTMVIAYTLLNILWIFVWLFFVYLLTGYRLWFFIKDTAPFAAAAFVVMTVAYLATVYIFTPWLLLICRIAIAAILYYAIMRMARVQILSECEQFIIKKIRSH